MGSLPDKSVTMVAEENIKLLPITTVSCSGSLVTERKVKKKVLQLVLIEENSPEEN